MMLLQIFFDVAPERAAEFEQMYREVYVPALQVQQGYLRSNLLRVFAPAMANEIGAAPTECNFTMQLVFDTEVNRRRWAASPEHVVAWAAASGMAKSVAWRGYDMVGYDG
jgi:hypothetical protein